jgi:hypothetical protein
MDTFYSHVNRPIPYWRQQPTHTHDECSKNIASYSSKDVTDSPTFYATLYVNKVCYFTVKQKIRNHVS